MLSTMGIKDLWEFPSINCNSLTTLVGAVGKIFAKGEMFDKTAAMEIELSTNFVVFFNSFNITSHQ